MTGDCVRGEDGSPAKKEELSHGTGSCVGCESGTLSTKDELCRATCGGVCDEGGRVGCESGTPSKKYGLCHETGGGPCDEGNSSVRLREEKLNDPTVRSLICGNLRKIEDELCNATGGGVGCESGKAFLKAIIKEELRQSLRCDADVLSRFLAGGTLPFLDALYSGAATGLGCRGFSDG